MEKIHNIEQSLMAIPGFNNKEIIGGKKPFLYSTEKDVIIMKGDFCACDKDNFMVTSIYPAQQTLKIKNAMDATTKTVTMDDINKDHYYRSYTVTHLPAKAFMDILSLLPSHLYYTIPDNSVKEDSYKWHLKSYNSSKFIPLLKIENNNLLICHEAPKEEEYLNPFAASSLDAIKSAATITFYSIYDNDEYKDVLHTMKNYMPQVFTELSKLLPMIPPKFDFVIMSHYNTPDNFKENIQTLCAFYPYYHNDPMKAAKAILDNIPKHNKDSFKTYLLKMGCINDTSLKTIITSFSEVASKEEPYVVQKSTHDRTNKKLLQRIPLSKKGCEFQSSERSY
jgi:hypothetical protein